MRLAPRTLQSPRRVAREEAHQEAVAARVRFPGLTSCPVHVLVLQIYDVGSKLPEEVECFLMLDQIFGILCYSFMGYF